MRSAYVGYPFHHLFMILSLSPSPLLPLLLTHIPPEAALRPLDCVFVCIIILIYIYIYIYINPPAATLRPPAAAHRPESSHAPEPGVRDPDTLLTCRDVIYIYMYIYISHREYIYIYIRVSLRCDRQVCVCARACVCVCGASWRRARPSYHSEARPSPPLRHPPLRLMCACGCAARCVCANWRARVRVRVASEPF
jgi:hypothetical protein